MDKFKIAGKILNKGAKFLAEGRTNPAINAFQKAIKIDKKLVAAHFDLALAYMQKGLSKKAIQPLEKVVKLKPDDFEALNLLGHHYMSLRMTDLALSCFQKAIKANPMMAEAHYNLGVCYMQKGMFAKALASYKKSLKVFPNNSIVYNNIGVTYEDMDQKETALKYFKKSAKINPENTMALSNIGAYYVYVNPQKAKDYFQKAIEVNPNMDSAHFNLGVALRILGDNEGAIREFQKTLQINPDNPMTYGQLYHQLRDVCDFKEAKKIEAKMRNLSTKSIKSGIIPTETIFVSVVYDDNPKRNRDIAVGWSKYIEEKVFTFKKPFSFVGRDKQKGKIKIGYVSSDFKDHATSHLIMGMLRLHDRKKFDIYTYSHSVNDHSHYRKEIEKITIFRDVLTLSDSKVADLIYKDKIDVLIDLKGHTTSTRMEIAALRPAPIAIHFLGFPGTTGANFVDYFITDHVLTPKKLAPYFTEKLIYLPNSYQANDNTQPVSKEIRARQQLSLPSDKFLFCSFNQPYKIDPQVLNSWAKILKKVPNSALCLLAKNQTQVGNLTRAAQTRGINPERLIFCLSLRKPVHLARVSLCNLALDTFICNGHTTTSDSLWAGVPVVTLLGKHFTSRVSGSLLTAIGLPELITHSQKEYEDLAVELATNPKKLKAISEKLKANRLTFPLFDTEKFTRNIEKAYLKAWEIYQKGQRPRNIYIK